ncbi:tyrosine-protein phosphatase [Pelagerythrobacter sp.]|uniref:tyrosine-protein phosphatase n=1 Tax=Pelagerythrobacter sp. TaxID=2800702 RepID=UPI0035AEEB92
MEHDRVIPLEGVHNFRDYGGYPVAGGGRMKRGHLFRSGQHVGASDADLLRIGELGLRHVIDFRGASERETYPCRRGDDFCAAVVAFEGETANLAPHVEAADGILTVDGAHRAMERIYRNLPNREPVLWVMRRYFATLAEADGPSLVHCLAGKDRTGMAVALLHHALGVHPDDAMADFLLTNTAGNIEARVAAGGETIRAKYGAADDDTIRVLMGVDERYLHAMREAVEDAHGSLDAFLADVLGVDDARRDALRLQLVDA